PGSRAMSVADEVLAVRSSVALADGAHLACVRLSGDGAFDAVSRACSCDLFLQDAQMRPALLLDERGLPFADASVCRDDEAFFLLCEGPTSAEIAAHVRASSPGGDLTVVDLGETHAAISLHGPYAWELLGECLGPDLVGLPYLSAYRAPFDGAG